MILSLFPGIDLLGMAFEQRGYCVVRGPDIICGGDIRDFSVTEPGKFEGIIAGPPCQDFSTLRRDPPTGYGLEMLEEFKRVVFDANPDWWLVENVAGVPDVVIDGYGWQRTDINLGWYTDCQRLRHIQFGSKYGEMIHIERGNCDLASNKAATASSDSRSFKELCALQGLPSGFDLPSFNVAGKKRAVGNGVPLPMGLALADAVTHRSRFSKFGRCCCGCGRKTASNAAKFYDFSCRKRAQRRRDCAAAEKNVTDPVEKCDAPAVEK